jgi:ABC-type sugar transport system substrate-binding protein
MKLKIMTAVLALFLLTSATGLAADKDNKTTHKKTRTLTGCLQKGDDAKEFNLVTGRGGTWEIKSDSVDLAPHIGHRVTVTGVVSNAMMHGMKEDAKEEAKEHGVDKKEKEHGHLTVTDVKMVSESCKK